MKHIFRRLLRSPMFTATTLLTLAIGIGANTAVFSVLEGILLKPLPYSQADQLVSVMHTAPGVNVKDLPVSPSCYFVYREEGRTFRDIALWTSNTVSVTGLAEPEEVPAAQVTDGMLGILGVRPLLGRDFTRKDDTPGSPLTAILSYGYWQRKFGADRAIIGRVVNINGKPREIIGVLPPTFQLADTKPSILTTFQFDPGKVNLGNFSFRSIARLRPDSTIQQASADIARMIPIVENRFAPPKGASRQMFQNTRMGPNLRPLKDDIVGDIGMTLWVLMGTIGIVLLIACANVANLLLVRVEGRQHELAIRAALGAGWTRIARELLLESVLLGAVGGLFGLGVAYGALRLLVAIAPATLPRLEEISVDGPVLLFAIGASLLSGLVFGIVPVLKFAGTRIASGIGFGGRTLGQSRERHRTRSALVVTQVALALVLLIAAGLMIRTFQSLRNVQPGFTRPEEVQTVTLSLPEGQVSDPEKVMRIQEAILRRMEEIPGVSIAAFASGVPLDPRNRFDPIYVEGQPVPEGKMAAIRQHKYTSPGIFRTLGNPILAGRDFTWTDIYDLAPVAVVTDNFAREYWGSPAAAVGKRIREMPNDPWTEIIGVVANERDRGVDRPSPTTIYWPGLKRDYGGQKLTVRRTVIYAVRSSRAGSQGFVDEIRKAIWSVNPELPLAGIRTLEEIYSRSMARTSFALVMLAVAGGMALLLGIIGIYGVISYSVSQRTREIGVRMALGAQRPVLTRMFVRDGLKLVAVGLVIGIGGAFALTRAMSSLLFGVSASDPMTYVVVSLGLAVAATFASYLPSRRAMRVDPMVALRTE